MPSSPRLLRTHSTNNKKTKTLKERRINLQMDRQTQIRREAEKAAQGFPSLLTEAEKLAKSITTGLHGRKRSGPGESFWQHRPYTFGDPVAAIDWRQSARSQNKLFVRQNEWEAAATIWFWRDKSKSMQVTYNEDRPTKLWRADVISTALAILLSSAGEKIGILGKNARAFHGRLAPERFLEALSVEDGSLEPWPSRRDAQAGARVLLIGDFYSSIDEIKAVISTHSIRTNGGIFLQIIDPDEEDFDYAGRIEFEDPETDQKLLFADTKNLAERYRHEFSAHQQQMNELCAKYGWKMMVHRSNENPKSALLKIYELMLSSSRRN